MIVERPHRIAGAIATAVSLVLVVVHARAFRAREPAVAVLPAIATPAAATPAVTSPVVGPPSSPPETNGGDPAIPSVRVSCMDSSTELLSDGANPVLCWGERCLVYRDHISDVAPRPAAAAELVTAVVGADQVCTGTRCDRLGPRLRAAVADVDPGQLSATRDHAAIVIPGGPEHAEIWNRAADRRVDLAKPRKDEGEVDAVYVIGDHVIVARSCDEYCSAIGSVVDAHGRRRGRSFAVAPDWGREPTRIVAVTDDLFVVFGGFGEIAMLDHGRVAASARIMGSYFVPEGPIDVQAVRIDDNTVAATWCVHDMCHLTRVRLSLPEFGMSSPELDLVDEQVLPACTR